MLPFDADVAGQTTERDAEFRREVHPAAEEEEEDAKEHEVAGDGFHMGSRLQVEGWQV